MQRTRLLAGVILALAAAVGSSAVAAGPPANLVKAQLVASAATIAPGDAFEIGVLLDIEEGWHIYWTNPGDSGVPTSVKLTLPDGFTADPFQYPTPRRFELPGNQVLYGYEHQVMLTAKVHPPTSIKLGDNVRLAAKVQWLTCKEACVPGSASLELLLKVDEHRTEAHADLFALWRARVPVGAKESTDVERIEVTAVARPMPAEDADATEDVVVQIVWKVRPTQLELFPGASDAIVLKPGASQNDDRAATVKFTLSRLKGTAADGPILPMVLGYEVGKFRKGISFDVSIAAIKN